MECCKSVHLLIGDKGKVSYIPTCCFDLVLFVVDLPATSRSVLYFKELGIGFSVFLNLFVFKQLITESGNTFVKSLLLVSTSFDAVEIVDVNPAFLFESIADIWPVLCVVPFSIDCKAISIKALIEVVKHTDVIIYIIKITLDEFEGELNSYKELNMFLVKTIYVVFRVKSAVHNKLGLAKSQNIQVFKQMLYRLGVWDISGKLAVIEWKT